MSGSAAPDTTKDQSTFDPDFRAKEMVERDTTWFQKRFGPKEDDNTQVGAAGKAAKSVGKGQKKQGKKSSVRIPLAGSFGYNARRLTALFSRPSVLLHEKLTLR